MDDGPIFIELSSGARLKPQVRTILKGNTFDPEVCCRTNMKSNPERRKYPDQYEKWIPAAIAVLVLIILGMLVVTIGIALNLITF